MSARSTFALLLFAICHPILPQAATAAADGRPAGTVDVPFDHEQPADGTFALHYELGRPFDPQKPTVFVITDGQQFYVADGRVAELQDRLFGDRFNVLGIIGRGRNDAVLDRIGVEKRVDWLKAWRLLNSDQWVADIERVRRVVLGTDGAVSLYGRSGGGLLVHQYLSRHPEHVATVFTQAAVNRFIDAELGLNSDTFWRELTETDAALAGALLAALERHPADRSRIMLLLQRQNFFVAAEGIARERAALVRAIVDGDQPALERYAGEYQVDQVLAMQDSPYPAVNVRLFELFAPVLADRAGGEARRVDPDLEVGRLFAAPLLELMHGGHIPLPSMDLEALHRVTADVYVLAGRYDHTADYRSQMALAARYPNHRLLLLADDHTFSALQAGGVYPRLVQAALGEGVRGPERAGVEEELAELVYREY